MNQYTLLILLMGTLVLSACKNEQKSKDLYLQGKDLLKEEKFAEAIPFFDQAIKAAPNKSSYYGNRGTAKLGVGDFEGSLNDYNKAIELEPKSAIAYFNRGNLKGQMEKHKEAITDFEKAIEIDPNLPDAYISLGYSYAGYKLHKDAVGAYSKAIELNPKDGYSYYYRGMSRVMLDEKENACADFKQADQLAFNGAKEMINRICE